MSLSFVSKSIQTTREDGGYDEKPIENNGDETLGTSSSTSSYQRPLFDQLRSNQEQDDAEREENQRNTMRGTLALDEEDAAHLQSIHESKMLMEQNKWNETQKEVDAYRLARANRFESTTTTTTHHQFKSVGVSNETSTVSTAFNAGNNSSENSGLLSSNNRNQHLPNKNKLGMLPFINLKRRRIDKSAPNTEGTVSTPGLNQTSESVTCNRIVKQQQQDEEKNTTNTFSQGTTGQMDDPVNDTINSITVPGKEDEKKQGPVLVGLLAGYGSSSSSSDEDDE